MIRYKIDVMSALKDAGYSTYRLQRERRISSSTTQKLRHGDTSLTVENLNTICEMLRCQPGDLLEWIPDEEEEP